MKNKFTDFLAAHGFSTANVDVEGTLACFRREMSAGLAGGASSLPMIPAYIGIDRPVPVDKPVVVLDAGGTNLRTAVMSFDSNGKPRIDKFTKFPMPGTQGKSVGAKEFYAGLATHLEPLLAESNDLGFCFSYPAEITPDCDARLLRWTKQVDIPEVVGTMIGGGLSDALKIKPRITILNDTVATLLAGKSAGLARRYATYVGFILGTGTNTAYVAPHSGIKKVAGLPARSASTRKMGNSFGWRCASSSTTSPRNSFKAVIGFSKSMATTGSSKSKKWEPPASDSGMAVLINSLASVVFPHCRGPSKATTGARPTAFFTREIY